MAFQDLPPSNSITCREYSCSYDGCKGEIVWGGVGRWCLVCDFPYCKEHVEKSGILTEDLNSILHGEKYEPEEWICEFCWDDIYQYQKINGIL